MENHQHKNLKDNGQLGISGQNSMKTILVTGGAGFTGGCFVRMIANRNDTCLINLDKLTSAGNLDSLASIWHNPNHVFVRGDIGDTELVKGLLQTYQPSAVIDFASCSASENSQNTESANKSQDIPIARNLLESVWDYWNQLSDESNCDFRYVHVARADECGIECRGYETTEQIREFHQAGLPTLIVKSENIFGPFQFPDKFIPQLILCAIEGTSLSLNECESSLGWLSVQDFCQAIEKVLLAGRVGECYAIKGSEKLSQEKIVEEVCMAVEELLPGLPHSPCSNLFSMEHREESSASGEANSNLRYSTDLDWKPEATFESGLHQTIAWYLANSLWLNRISTGEDRRTNSGSAIQNHELVPSDSPVVERLRRLRK